MSKKKILSIIVPVYQNEPNLDTTITKLLALQPELSGFELELVLVDDGSTDGSLAIMQQFLGQDHRIKIVKLSRNFGQIAAIQAGMKIAAGDCVGIISADLQDDHCLFIKMAEKWQSGSKLIIAERDKRSDGLFKDFVSEIHWKLVNIFAVKGFPIGGFDFCLIDRSIITVVNSLNEKNTHIFALVYYLGYKIEKLSYNRDKRVSGRSQWGFFKKLKLSIDIFIAFSYMPVRFISLVGVVMAFASFSISVFAVIQKAIYGNPYTGWASLAFLVSFIGGLVLLSLGVIGEYLWRILDQSRKRPGFVIEEIYHQPSDPDTRP